ncbi:MAG: hypothetical protein AAFR61_10900 [Bacteroidota bacterium]
MKKLSLTNFSSVKVSNPKKIQGGAATASGANHTKSKGADSDIKGIDADELTATSEAP